MKLKKIVTLISSAILAFSLVGCSIEGEESSLLRCQIIQGIYWRFFPPVCWYSAVPEQSVR